MESKYVITDEKELEQLKVFKDTLNEKGYTPRTATRYTNSAKEYLSTKRPITKEAIDEYFYELLHKKGLTESQKNGISSKKMGIVRFYDLFYGDASNLKPGGKKNHYNWKRKECNYDCLNCIHPKCIFE